MAKVTKNILAKGLRGKLGDNLVARTRNGKTFFYFLEVKNNPDSPKQKKRQEKFTKAIAFAKEILADPVLKEEYKKKARLKKKESAYSMAISEYMKKE